ncbi:MAG: hypothetical protein P8Y58_04090 [Novosphingobium sp.]
MALPPSLNPLTAYGFDAAGIAGLIQNPVSRLVGMFRQDAATAASPPSPGTAILVTEPDAASGGETRFLRSPAKLSPGSMGWADMQQFGPTSFLDCQVISAAAALARADPDAAGRMVTEVTATYQSRTKQQAEGARGDLYFGETMLDVAFSRGTVRISPRLYFRDQDRKQLVHAHDAAKPADGTWIALVEKAYAVEWGNEYDAISDRGPGSLSTRRVCFDLWGSIDEMVDGGGNGPLASRVIVALSLNADLDPRENKTFTTALLTSFLTAARQRPTVATTPYFGSNADPLTNNFIGGHTYVVLGDDGSGNIEFWEPMRHMQPSLPVAEFFTVFDALYRRAGG